MSTPVKPPGGPDGPDGPIDAGDPIDGARGAFEKVVERVAEATGDANPVEGTDALGGLERALRAGELTPDAAIDRLVERALAQARGLTSAERDALEAQLRDALENDPTLLDLRKDLQRAAP